MGNYWEEHSESDVSPHKDADEIEFGVVKTVYEAEESKQGFFSVDVAVKGGGIYREVIYNGTFGFDYGTNKCHGIFIPPREGQAVMLGFYKKRLSMPQILTASPLPNESTNEGAVKEFHKLLKKDAISLFHFNGSRVDLTSDSKIFLNATGDEGNLEFATKGEELKTQLEALIDQIKLITVGTGVGPSSTPINSAAFDAIKSNLSDILSENVKLD